jgi:3-oxoacyl-[acyl-carrier-protein] synthase II
MKTQKVVITGIGVVSPYGIGRDLFWEQLHQGVSAAKWIDSFDASGMPTRFWANTPQTDEELTELLAQKKIAKLLTRSGKMSLIATVQAVAQSGLDFTKLSHERVGLSVGVGGIGLTDPDVSAISFDKSNWLKVKNLPEEDEGKFWETMMSQTHPLLAVKAIPNSISAHLSIAYQVQGNCQTLTTACTSSSQAIGEAFHKVKFGLADVVIAGGSDSVTNPSSMLSFSLLGVLSKNNAEFQTASRPFDRDRDGFLLGEGAAFFILENAAHCKKRGGNPLAELSGFGCTSDAFRVTDEPDDARGSIAAMRGAIAESGLRPSDISYINAHGTSTRMNDTIETFAIKQVFGETARKIPVSSNKSMIGHLVAGAGAIELAASVLSLQNQIIPPTINLKNPDVGCDLDYVPGEARSVNLTAIISNSFGFGGQNSCLLIRKVSTI